MQSATTTTSQLADLAVAFELKEITKKKNQSFGRRGKIKLNINQELGDGEMNHDSDDVTGVRVLVWEWRSAML